MNTIYITLEHPHNLKIAVRTGQADCYGAYNILSTEYGWGDCMLIEDSDQFKKISMKDLPDELKIDEGFKRIQGNIQAIYIHK